MHIHYLQHVPFEGLGSIEDWINKKKYTLSCTRLFAGDPFPELTGIDWLIIMGGPMGVYDTERYPWLKDEKSFIKQCIESNKILLGICLGAQLIADVLGAKIKPNLHKEIGWYPISRVRQSSDNGYSTLLPDNIEVFHWHGDTFELPENAIPIASSKACQNQAFVYDQRIFAFQFHLETTMESASSLIHNCKDELVDAPYIQTGDAMLANEKKFTDMHRVMDDILNHLSSLKIQL